MVYKIIFTKKVYADKAERFFNSVISLFYGEVTRKSEKVLVVDTNVSYSSEMIQDAISFELDFAKIEDSAYFIEVVEKLGNHD